MSENNDKKIHPALLQNRALLFALDLILLPYKLTDRYFGHGVRFVLAVLLVLSAFGFSLVLLLAAWFNCASGGGGSCDDVNLAILGVVVIPGVVLALYRLGSYALEWRGGSTIPAMSDNSPFQTPVPTCDLCGGIGMASPIYQCNRCGGSGMAKD